MDKMWTRLRRKENDRLTVFKSTASGKIAADREALEEGNHMSKRNQTGQTQIKSNGRGNEWKFLTPCLLQIAKVCAGGRQGSKHKGMMMESECGCQGGNRWMNRRGSAASLVLLRAWCGREKVERALE
jgi:hypothetical protein